MYRLQFSKYLVNLMWISIGIMMIGAVLGNAFGVGHQWPFYIILPSFACAVWFGIAGIVASVKGK